MGSAAGCTEVDVFLVGGGGGSGYTKTYKRNNIGIKQGSQISVTPGQEINIIVGKVEQVCIMAILRREDSLNL